MRRYLIVDDNRAFAENLAEILARRAATRSTVARDGARRSRCARGPRFDALVTDMRMPVMSGAELVHRDPPGRSRRCRRWSITAYTGDDELEAARARGAARGAAEAGARRARCSSCSRARGATGWWRWSRTTRARRQPLRGAARARLRRASPPLGARDRAARRRCGRSARSSTCACPAARTARRCGGWRAQFPGPADDRRDRATRTRAAACRTQALFTQAVRHRRAARRGRAAPRARRAPCAHEADARSRRASSSSTTTRRSSTTSPRSWRTRATRCAAPAPAPRRSRARATASTSRSSTCGCPTATAPRSRRELKERVAGRRGGAPHRLRHARVGRGGGARRRLRLPREAVRHAGAAASRVEQAMRQVRLHGEKRELARRAQMAEKLAAVGTHDRRASRTRSATRSTPRRCSSSVLERRVQQARREPAAAAARAAHARAGRDPPARPHPRGLPPVRPPARVRAAARRRGAVVARVLDLLGGEAERRGVRLERRPRAGAAGRRRRGAAAAGAR